MHGEIRLTHAPTAARAPSAHPDAPAGFAAVRRARLAAGSVGEVVKHAAEFARRLETLPGFNAYQVMDCGDGDIIAVSHFRERTSAEQSDELAARFAQDELQRFDLERNESFGGGVILVSREADAARPGEHV